MKLLVLNSGGSSVKYKLYDMSDESVLLAGGVERLNEPSGLVKHRWGAGQVHEEEMPSPSHQKAILRALELVVDPGLGGLASLSEVEAVGHRVVHAGEHYTGSVLITPDVVRALEECSDLAPLHNPPNLAGIRAAQAAMPQVPHVAVFDNALHHTVKDYAYTYALPYEYFEKYRIRRYGFHGVAFRSATAQAAELLEKPLSELRLVTLMLGSGCTANAMKHGASCEVSTGFTPLEGLIQSTRTGDMDPAVLLYIMEKEGKTPAEMNALLNKQSGWYGISGVSQDMREVTRKATEGDYRANLAIQAFCHRAKKYVGAYAAAMGGIDALVFAGGVGENECGLRAEICGGLEFLGLYLDSRKNRDHKGKPGVVSTDASPASIVVVACNEELVIARDTAEVAAREG